MRRPIDPLVKYWDGHSWTTGAEKDLRPRKRQLSHRERLDRAQRLYGLTSTEAMVKQRLEADGKKVLRRGWPDFLVVGPNGLEFVEVKRRGQDCLNEAQVEMHATLAAHGLTVRVEWVG